ncbi:hypothetical protein EV426DRAFT_430105 [Tirmania nivea]|nr:hypothetical protein EV426DRAFT_430105 [Tirmania nivea]
MNVRTRGHQSPEADTEQQPKRKAARYQESTPTAGPSTYTLIAPRLPSVSASAQGFRPVLPKPAFTSSGGSVLVNVAPPEMRVADSQEPQAHQPPEGPGVTLRNLTTDTNALGPADPSFAPHTSIHDLDVQAVFAPLSIGDTLMRNKAPSLDVPGQTSPNSPTLWGHCFICDDLWRTHRESMMGLLRAQGISNGLDSTPVTCNIFSSYFAFQDHAQCYHGWRLCG